MEGIRIRDARPSDEPALLPLHRALHIEHRRAVVPEEERALHAFQDFERLLTTDLHAMLNGDTHVLVAAEGGALLGYVTGEAVREPFRLLGPKGVVGDWFVVAAARGRGLGRALMEALLDRFRAHGCGMVESSTLAPNGASRALHTHLGFSEVEVRYRKKL